MAIKKISANLLGNNAVTAASIAGGAISAADIADNSIGITQLNVSDGTNGQVLTTNGSGTLSFGDIPAGYTDSDVETYLNTSAIYTDATNNRLGIGTSSPAKLLTLSESADGAKFRINRSGVSEWDFSIGNTSTLTGVGSGALELLPQNSGTANEFAIGTAGSSAPLFHLTNSQAYFAGNVGIGTTSPEHPLHVNGGTTNTVAQFQSTDAFALIEFKDSNAGASGCFIGGAGDDFVVSPNANEKFRVTSAGNVGIGTNNPTGNLEVKSTAEAAAYITGSASSLRLLAYDTDGSCYIQSGTSTASSQAPLYISGMNGTNITAAFDTANQRVLIGATSNTSSYTTLEVYGSPAGGGQAPSAIINGGIDNSPCLNCIKTSATTSSSARFIQFYANTMNTPMGGIVGNGSANAQFQSISDERLKENIQSLSGSLDKVLALNPVSYDWKDNGEHIEAGFVAQEVEQILPEYVTTEDDEDQIKGLTGGMTAGYIAVLTKAIQEQQTIIDDLKSRLDSAGL